MTRLYRVHFYCVYFRGTSNVAANRIVARSPRAAVQIASAIAKTPAAYLVAREVQS